MTRDHCRAARSTRARSGAAVCAGQKRPPRKATWKCSIVFKAERNRISLTDFVHCNSRDDCLSPCAEGGASKRPSRRQGLHPASGRNGPRLDGHLIPCGDSEGETVVQAWLSRRVFRARRMPSVIHRPDSRNCTGVVSVNFAATWAPSLNQPVTSSAPAGFLKNTTMVPCGSTRRSAFRPAASQA